MTVAFCLDNFVILDIVTRQVHLKLKNVFSFEVLLINTWHLVIQVGKRCYQIVAIVWCPKRLLKI